MNLRTALFGICTIVLLTTTIALISDDTCAAKISNSDTSGSLGDNIRWTYDSDSQEMVVSGYGSMYLTTGFFEEWTRDNTVNTLRFVGNGLEIGDRSFVNFRCNEIIIGEGVKSIGRQAFYNTSAKTITLPASLESKVSVGKMAFAYADVETLYINGYYGIGDSEFKGCKDLKTIIFGPGVKLIDSIPFSDCSSITSITIPSSIEGIYWHKSGISCYPFADLSSYNELNSINISGYNIPELALPSNVEYVNISNTNTTKISFGDAHLKSLYLRDQPSLSELDFGVIDPLSMGESFKLTGLPNVTTISASASNPYVVAMDNVLYSKDLKTLYYYPSGLTADTLTIPEGVTTVYDIANDHLKNIVFPNSMKECGLITGNSILCLNIPKNITEGIYSTSATYNSLKVVMMPTQFHYNGVENDHTIIKYYSKYIERAYATVDTDGKVSISVDTVSGANYPFRIGIQYNESDILQSSFGTAELPADYIYYPKLYLSIESNEIEESNEWVPQDPADKSMSHVIIVGIISVALIIIGAIFWKPLSTLGVLGLILTGIMWIGTLLGIYW